MLDDDSQPTDITSALELLDLHKQAGGSPTPTVIDGRLPHSTIDVLPAAFQPRTLGDDTVDPYHAEELRKVLERRGEQALDPILVYWSGQSWFVVDGHHRLAAYRSSEHWRDRSIPVETFEGSALQAVSEATERNVKTTLSLMKTDKSTAGWRLVCLTDLKVKEVMAKADLSQSQVKKMRSRLRELLAKFPDKFTKQSLSTYPWQQVLQASFGGPEESIEIDEDWVTKLAHDLHARLRKNFSDKLEKNPDAFAMAIRMLHNGLPSMLMESPDWEEDRNAKLDAWTDERDNGYDF